MALALLLLATWGSGGEAKWATGLIIIAGGLGLLALVLTSGNIPKGLIIAGLLWITAATWSVIQSLEIGPLAHPLWAEATRALPSMQGGSIALDPHAARMSGVMTLSLAGVACLGIVVARQDRAMAVLLGLSGIIALFSLAALLQMSDQAAGPRDIVRHAADASFPFTSRNTFCAFAGVGVIASASLLAASRAHQRVLQAFCLGCLLCCTAGVLSSHSRAGLAVVAAGSAISLILVSRRPAMLFLVGLAGLALVAVSMSGITGERTASLGEDYGVRLAIWRASAEIAWQHLWLGVGSLDQALQMHAGEWGERHILRADNISLQAAAERGLP
ncbi:MAG: O-antigen ligase family protein, partial [Alphaproteobacteria bacterium]